MSYLHSYWNKSGRYDALGKQLALLVPTQGSCVIQKDGKAVTKLNRYRRATNCYYDLFNNGLINRAQEFRSIFGFSPKKEFSKINYRAGSMFHGIDFVNDRLYAKCDEVMDRIILAAAQEQGLEIVEPSGMAVY